MSSCNPHQCPTYPSWSRVAHEISCICIVLLANHNLVVGIGLWQVLLQEGQVSIGRLGTFLGGVGGSGLGGGLGERWLLSVKLGQFRGEVGGKSRGGRSLGLVEASDTAGCVGSLHVLANDHGRITTPDIWFCDRPKHGSTSGT